MNEINKALINFTENELQKTVKKFQTAEKLRKEFINKFPVSNIINMQLDDYVVGKGKKSFCYWLETKLRDYGSIKVGSTADKSLEYIIASKMSSIRQYLNGELPPMRVLKI